MRALFSGRAPAAHSIASNNPSHHINWMILHISNIFKAPLTPLRQRTIRCNRRPQAPSETRAFWHHAGAGTHFYGRGNAPFQGVDRPPNSAPSIFPSIFIEQYEKELRLASELLKSFALNKEIHR
ncbi:MAG: hypothetical protein RR311_20405 [Comamonas sp.]